jgi:hypothetical protein
MKLRSPVAFVRETVWSIRVLLEMNPNTVVNPEGVSERAEEFVAREAAQAEVGVGDVG